MFTYALGTCFEYIWNANMTLVKVQMNMEKVIFIWDYFSPTFTIPNEMKKYVLESRQDGEGTVLGGTFQVGFSHVSIGLEVENWALPT